MSLDNGIAFLRSLGTEPTPFVPVATRGRIASLENVIESIPDLISSAGRGLRALSRLKRVCGQALYLQDNPPEAIQLAKAEAALRKAQDRANALRTKMGV